MTDRMILFDIDATLLTTGGKGFGAMIRAGKDLFGEHFNAEGVDRAGRLDPLIIADLFRVNRVEPTLDRITTFRSAYADRLKDSLAEGGATALPGVHDLLDSVMTEPGPTCALMTGNFAETARLKLAAAGIDPDRFPFGVWGDDAREHPPSRDQLPGVALRRFADLRNVEADPARVVVIGDTVHDISCARAWGCRVLAVATGSYTREDLAGADRVVDDLSDTESILDWLLS
ncbi:MAG: haloacid dehalogenase-like hydrolase [Phycisphaerales bacterium]|nr:haloacid dehalogenase-like hydrolase [Phycisphaerales bacterium]